MDEAGRQRVIIEGVEPEIDCGRFPVKRTVGEPVEVEADAHIFRVRPQGRSERDFDHAG